MKRISIILALIYITITTYGQVNRYGIPMIKNYSAETIHGSDYTHSIIKDNLGNVYFANEDMGIIRYDGNTWRTIIVRNNQLIRALGKDNQGTIYAGGKYEFGFLEPDVTGKMAYVSLSQRFDETEEKSVTGSDSMSVTSQKRKVDIGEILSLVVKGSNVYFLSSKALFDYDIIKDSVRYVNIISLGLKNALKIFLVGDRIIISDNTSGLCEYKNGKIEVLNGGGFFNEMPVMMVLPYDVNRAIVATYKDGLYLYNYITGEISTGFVDPALQKLLIGSRIYTGTSLPSGEFALGTIQGGIFVIDQKGRLIKHWDKDNSGLMDNGVLAFYCDPSGASELWISTIRYISKVYINIPFTEFSPKSGLNGGVDCICEMDNNVYVSTDFGVYKSRTSDDGLFEFYKIPEIIDQVFPLYHAKIGDEEFILAGSINGLFQIKKSGKVVKITDNTPGLSERDRKLNLNIRIIVQSKLNPAKFYVGCNADGVSVIEYISGEWKRKIILKCGQGTSVGIVEKDNGDIIIATDYGNNVFHMPANDTVPILYGKEKGIPESTVFSVTEINKEIVIATGTGIYKYLQENDSWVPYNDITANYSAGKESHFLMQDSDGDLWFAHKDIRYSEMLFRKSDGKIKSFFGSLALLPNVRLIDIKSINGRIWIAKSNSVFVIEKENLLSAEPLISPLLTRINVGRDSLILDETFNLTGEWGKKIPVSSLPREKIPELRYNLNSMSFFWSTPYFINEEATLYSFKLDGFDTDWSGWEKVYYKDYTNLPYGHYHFRVKAKTATEIITNETVYEFYILKPWYLTTVMLVIFGIALILIILGIITAYTQKLKNENIRLEGIVLERTAVVVKQKEELESSIHYASRIQMALLPSEAILKENIENFFVLFKPRDIVSGDFYWMTKKGERLYIVAADCTGHGVPGAFMSLLGMSFLDEIIDKELAPRADAILRELRLHVTESLKQVGNDDEAKDGMDMGLLVIDFASRKVEFSGAYNPCFKVRKLTEDEAKKWNDDPKELADGIMSDGKYILETIFASKMPIGISSRMSEEFVFHEHALEKGTSYYLFSDGYIDQFGGPEGRKFMKKSFKRLILEIQEYPMETQKEILEKNLMKWKGSSPQIDDILVLGMRID